MRSVTIPVALRVLFAHGGSDDREMYSEYLREHQFDVIETGTTDDALMKLADAHIVITGLMMPGSMHPVELIERIRHGSSTAATPILVVTASCEPSMLDAARRAGADVVLTKPCYPHDLLEQLQRILDERGIREVGDGIYLVPVADRRSKPRPVRR